MLRGNLPFILIFHYASKLNPILKKLIAIFGMNIFIGLKKYLFLKQNLDCYGA